MSACNVEWLFCQTQLTALAIDLCLPRLTTLISALDCSHACHHTHDSIWQLCKRCPGPSLPASLPRKYQRRQRHWCSILLVSFKPSSSPPELNRNMATLATAQQHSDMVSAAVPAAILGLSYGSSKHISPFEFGAGSCVACMCEISIQKVKSTRNNIYYVHHCCCSSPHMGVPHY